MNMLKRYYDNLVNGKHSKLIFYNALIWVLGLGLVINMFITYSVYRSKRTIIIPAPLKASLSISDIDVSPETLRIMVYDALDLLYSYFPDSAENRFDTFMKAYAFPSRLKDMHDLLRERLDDILKQKKSQSFEPQDFQVIGKGTILVAGKIIPSTLGQTAKPEPVFMQIEYRIDEGSVKILSFTELSRTQYDNLVQRRVPAEQIARQREQKQKEQLNPQRSGAKNSVDPFDPNAYRDFSLGDDDTTNTAQPTAPVQ